MRSMVQKPRERKVKAVIPKPNNDSVLDRLGLSDLSLNINLADNARDAVENLRSTVQEETQKTRHMILWLAIIQATATIVAASFALVV